MGLAGSGKVRRCVRARMDFGVFAHIDQRPAAEGVRVAFTVLKHRIPTHTLIAKEWKPGGPRRQSIVFPGVPSSLVDSIDWVR